MKHFFPFLTIPLILCVLLYTSPMVSVSAQQHNSFASAKSISLDHSVSISLSANVTEYYYFTSLQSADYSNQKYQITLSDADSLSVSAYDDQGSPVNLKQTNTSTSYWTGYIDNISNNTRFFLVLQNQTKQDVSIRLSISLFCSVTAAPKSDSNTQKATTVKPDKKSKPSSSSKKTTTQKPKKKTEQTSAPKTTSRQNSSTKHTATQNPRSTSEQASDKKATTATKQQNISRHTSDSKEVDTQKSVNNSGNYSISKGTTPVPKTTPTINGSSAGTETSLPEYTSNNQNMTLPTPEYHSDYSMNHSRSNSILSTHFFRISAGYSISAYELLPIDSSNSEITLETMTPTNLSLQNNIIYAKTPGLAVIKICSGNAITSCTIYIQE